MSSNKDASLERALSAVRLFQRWFVRRSKKFIATHMSRPKNELVAVSIVPWGPAVGLGQLLTINVGNLQRRLKYALNKADLDVALGRIDFSFNEDYEQKYLPFWSPHFYLITSTADKATLKKKLCKLFSKTDRPVKITPFKNKAFRRSYALKMNFRRRIGYWELKSKKGKIRNCRNTSRDKLRAAERHKLFMYLERIGFADRVFFLSAEPIMKGQTLKIETC